MDAPLDDDRQLAVRTQCAHLEDSALFLDADGAVRPQQEIFVPAEVSVRDALAGAIGHKAAADLGRILFRADDLDVRDHALSDGMGIFGMCAFLAEPLHPLGQMMLVVRDQKQRRIR